MPGDNTTKLEIQSRINTFMELMKYAPNNEENAALYQVLQEKMNALNGFFSSRESENEQDPPRPFTKEQKGTLTRLYNEAIEAAKNLGEAPALSTSERSMQDIAQAMEKLLKRDRDVVRSVDTRLGLSLDELVTEARTDYVDLGEPDNVTVKPGIKERMPIEFTDEDGNIRRGFFTKARKVLTEDEMDAFKEQKISEFPNLPGYRDMIRRFVEYADRNSIAVYTKTLPSTFDRQKARNIFLSPFLCELPLNKDNTTGKWTGEEDDINIMVAAENMADNTAFLGFFSDFFQSVQRAFQYNETATQMLNLEPGDILEHRGPAMSNVADLLGASSLIARGTPMKVRLGEEELEGTFIEQAEGLDVRGQKHDSPLFNVEQGKLTDPMVVKQLSDLMVLDYICNNQPRQADHMIYQFDNSGKLVGIRGIDNDSSFMEPAPTDGAGDFLSMNKVNPMEMLVISEDMANHVMNLSEESLRFTLTTSKLSENAINESCERLRDLQSRILEGATYFENKPLGVESGKLRVLKDDEFAQLPVRELVFKPKNKNMPTTGDEPRNTPLAKVYNLQKNARSFFRDEHGFMPEQIDQHPEVLQQESQALPERFAKGRLIERNINSVGLLHRLMTEDLEMHKLEAAKIADALKKASTLYKSSELKTAAEKAKAFSDKLAKLNASSRMPELAKVSELGKSAFVACNNLVTKLNGQKPLPEQLSKIMKIAKLGEQAIGQKYATFCHVRGEKVMTNELAVRLTLGQARKGLEAELAKTKPDAGKLQRFFAMERMAAELKSRPKDGLFNETTAPAMLKQLETSPEVKQQAADYSLRLSRDALRYTQTLKNKRLFFEPEFLTESGNLKPTTPYNRIGMGADRTALNSLTICVLLRDGHHLRDILDPSKLQNERLQAGREVLDMYCTLGDDSLASVSAELIMTGMEATMQQVNASMRELSAFNGQEFRKPQNAYLFAVAGLLQDMGQELDENREIRQKAELLESPERVEELLNRQAGGNKMLDALMKGEQNLMLLSEGKVVSFDIMYSVDAEWAKAQDNPNEQIRSTVLDSAMKGAFSQKFMNKIQRGSNFEFFSTFEAGKQKIRELEPLLDTLEDSTDLTDSFKNQLKGDVPFNAVNLAKGLLTGKFDLSKQVSLDKNNQPSLKDFSDQMNNIPRRDKDPQVQQRSNSGGPGLS